MFYCFQNWDNLLYNKIYASISNVFERNLLTGAKTSKQRLNEKQPALAAKQQKDFGPLDRDLVNKTFDRDVVQKIEESQNFGTLLPFN